MKGYPRRDDAHSIRTTVHELERVEEEEEQIPMQEPRERTERR